MSRTLTSAATTESAKATGAKPRLVLRVDFGGAIGTKYYSDTALSTPVTAEARLMNAGELNLQLSGQGLHAVSDISIELSDSDATLRGYLDATTWAMKRATLYQHFVGNNEADMLPLLVGYIDGAPQWKEADATVEFDITDAMTGYNVTIGHVAGVSDFAGICPDQEGISLPLVFGRVKDLKCVQVTGGLKGSLVSDLAVGDASCVVEEGEKFPQGTAITVRINGEYLTGSFAGKKFTITGRNTAVFTGTSTDNTSGNIHAVYDSAGPSRDNVFSGMWIDIGVGYWAAKVEKYFGSSGKYQLYVPIRQDGTTKPQLIGAGTTYYVRGLFTTPSFHFAGSTVEYVQGLPTVYYIANDARSLAVHRVKGLKKYENAVGTGGSGNSSTEQLVDIPADLYSVNLKDTTTFAALGRAVTTIALAQPLTQLEGQEWASDDIWVELSGYTRDGASMIQNPADVIRYLLQDFGEIPAASIDTASFAAAATSTAYRNFSFALREQRQMSALVADLAFQAQCQLLVIGGVVYLYYLSDQPGTSRKTFDATTNDNVDENSVTRTWQPLDSIWTEITAVYEPDLSDRREAKEHKFILKDATAEASFGRRVGQEMDLWAYRNVNQAKAVAQYYLNRHSRAWGRMVFRSYLEALALLPMDWVTVGGLVGLAAGQKAMIEGLHHAPGSGEDERPDKIEIETFIPVYPGCATTCEIPCEGAGCEGGAEHGCVTACETSCTSTCETSCQDNCQLTCVTKCELGCTLACQQDCQTTVEQTGCAGGSCETTCQEGCVADCMTGNQASDCDSSVESGPCKWDCMTVSNQTSCSMYSCQSYSDEPVSCTACETACQVTCQLTCQAYIEAGCDVRCEANCENGGCETASETIGPDCYFVIVAPASVTRGVAFNISIQSREVVTGDLDTAYVPTGDVTIDETNCTDAADDLIPAYTSSSGWVNGQKTVSCTIDGGEDFDTLTITVTDSATGRTGSASVAIDPVVVTKDCGDQYAFYGTDACVEIGTDDSDGTTAAKWANVQTDALANLNADTTLANCVGSPALPVAMWGVYDEYDYINFDAIMFAGYCQFASVTTANAVGLQLRVKALAVKNESIIYSSQVFADYDDASGLTLNVFLSEDPTYADGATLRANEPHFRINFEELNRLQAAAGGTAVAPALVSIPLMSAAVQAFLAGMSGSTIYAWMWVSGSNVDYNAAYQDKGTTAGPGGYPFYNLYAGFSAYVSAASATAKLDVLYSA